MKHTKNIIYVICLSIAFTALLGCEAMADLFHGSDTDNSEPSESSESTGTPGQVTDPATNAEHLAMLRNLGVDVAPALPEDPNGQPYEPSARPGPVGKIFSFPKREIFVAGYNGVSTGKSHALYEDFEDLSTLKILAQDSRDDSGWAAGNANLPKKSVAADLDGDGLDEVVIVTLNVSANKILISKGVYKNGGFTVAIIRTLDVVGDATIAAMLSSKIVHPHYISWKLIAADLDGDGKQECVFTLPCADGIYILDNNLAVIASGNVNSIIPTVQGHQIFNMVTAADYDQDGKDELCFMFGANNPGSYTAEYVILDDRDANFEQLDKGSVIKGTVRMNIGSVIAADFTGDGLPDTAFCGNNSAVLLLETTMTNGFKPDFNFKSASGTIGPNSLLTPQLAAGDVDGDGIPELYATDRLYKFDADGKMELFKNVILAADYDYYDVVMGDVTGDMIDDVVRFYGWGKVEIYYRYAEGLYTLKTILITSAGSDRETGCLPNVDNDSFILRDTGQRELLFSDPQVIAVLASPPYYDGINEDGDGGTSFGYSKSSGTSSSNSAGFSVGYSFGFEYEAPFGLASFEFETSITNSFGWTQSNSVEISESWGWNTPLAQDLVIFTAIPFDVYYYEVVVAPDGDEARPGDMMTINVPRKPRQYHHPLSVYNAGVPEEHRVTVNHTLGDPSSYFNASRRDAQKAAAGNKGLFSTNTQMTAGGGSGSTTINIESVKGKEESFSFEQETEISAKVGGGGVTVGYSAGFSYGYETTTSVSEGTWIEGTVPAIPSASYTNNLDFKWGLMAYPRVDGSQNYVFVTYWVTPYTP